MKRIAIVAALAQELGPLHNALQDARIETHAGRELHLGRLGAHDVVLVLCRVGKVAAAITATVLISHYEVQSILFTGVAGGLGAGVKVGDVVVADALLQHDMDARPIFPRFEVPLYGTDRFWAHPPLSDQLMQAAQTALPAGTTVHRGLILSGDVFVNSHAQCDALRGLFPTALAVEMEGAAVAQVCHDYGLPFAVVRTISDRADDEAHVDFLSFIEATASGYSVALVMGVLAGLAQKKAR
jgi:adenosylhomocysteine nucleosidase